MWVDVWIHPQEEDRQLKQPLLIILTNVLLRCLNKPWHSDSKAAQVVLNTSKLNKFSLGHVPIPLFDIFLLLFLKLKLTLSPRAFISVQSIELVSLRRDTHEQPPTFTFWILIINIPACCTDLTNCTLKGHLCYLIDLIFNLYQQVWHGGERSITTINSSNNRRWIEAVSVERPTL